MNASDSPAIAPLPPQQPLLRALVVDDSLPIRHLVANFLKSTGVITVVGTAVDGRDALRRIVELNPDVVFMDIEMPVMDGIEATRRIKLMEHAPRVIIVSFAPPSVIRLALKMGADGHCEKDRLPGALLHQIRAVFPDVVFPPAG